MPQLHPAHYAREVRGWVESLLMLLDNRNRMQPDQFRAQLHSMATDGYFLRAYDRMDAAVLSDKDRLLAKWLYGQKYFLLKTAGFLRKAKNTLKGNY